jgi:UDP-N-acetylmuramoyl-L-alanyl-D-glutamate--2,6-diaminopimelate ligase
VIATADVTAAQEGPTTLDELIAAVEGRAVLHPPDAGAVTVHDVTHDSRDAAPGVLFACRPGEHADGHDFAPDAVAAGSPALLVERTLPLPVPQLEVEAVADALGPVAAQVHRHPSRELALCGVTGTNGKTTITYLLDAALRAGGHRTGVIGTVRTVVDGAPLPGLRTTPEGTDLQRLLRRMRAADVTAAAMEVSSHGLTLRRVDGTRFAVVVFTNLTQDHLDFHGDMESYFAAKARLFTPAFAHTAVINVDDPYGRRIAEVTDLDVVAVSVDGAPTATVTAAGVQTSPAGSAFEADVGGETVSVETGLPGRFNVTNTLCALAAADVVGVPTAQAVAGIASLRGVPGRMERVDAGQAFTVLVDYAHTPDSLEHVLRAARDLGSQRVLVVVGCGGERDREKRPLMGEVATSLADVAFLTSDNPRGEDPLAILNDIVVGAARADEASWQVIADRREAIAAALEEAAPGDTVVIAGKGHEQHQEVDGELLPFDDRVVARDVLEGRA